MAIRQLRSIRIEGNTAIISLTQGYEAIVDLDDLRSVTGYNWRAVVKGNTVYAARSNGPRGHLVTTYLHRQIMQAHSDSLIDHIDGNGLNNLKSNLRPATVAQNQHNRPVGKKNTSGFKGVCWSKRERRWQANIRINGIKKSLGLHDTPGAAHLAYSEASQRLHGEFGRVS